MSWQKHSFITIQPKLQIKLYTKIIIVIIQYLDYNSVKLWKKAGAEAFIWLWSLFILNELVKQYLSAQI